MKKIRLNESDIENIVRIVLEQESKESTYGQCSGNNNISSPIVKTTISTKNKVPSSVSFQIVAYFDTTKSSENVYKDSLLMLKKQIDDKLSSLNIIAKYSYNLVEVTKVIGSASNYLNGPLKPTVYNNGYVIPENKLNEIPYNSLPGEGNSNWSKNMEYAKNRWSNMLNYIRTNGNSLGIKVDSKLNKPSDIKSWIRDTGGCIDEERDVNKYPIAGQSVLVRGKMNLIPEPPTEEDLDKMLECAEGLRIVVGYFKTPQTIGGIDFPKNKEQHSCNFATFDILCNDVVVGISNMNNQLKQTQKTKDGNVINIFKDGQPAQEGKDQPGYNGPKETGGTVYTVIDVPTNELKTILSKSNNGQIKMFIQGHKGSYTRSGNYHGAAPMVCAYVLDKEGNKRIVYGPKEPFNSGANVSSNNPRGDVGPKKRFMDSFNPCIETKVVPA